MRSGFEIVYFTCFFTSLLIPVFILRTLKSKITVDYDNSNSQPKSEHSQKIGLVMKIVNFLLNCELSRISKLKKYLSVLHV